MKKLILLLGVCFYSISLMVAQSSALPLDNNIGYHAVDRLKILSGFDSGFNSPLKAYTRKDIVDFALHLDTAYLELSDLDRADLDYIFKDNNEFVPKENENSRYYFSSKKPRLKWFYKTPANFFEVDKEHFYVKINPILNIQLAKDNESDNITFTNLRGIELRGGFDDKIYFYTNLHESQQKFPKYIDQYIEKNQAIPLNGFYRTYRSSIFDSSDSYDLLNSQAYIGFNATRHVGVQFGHGRNFVGNGYRSMLLSNFSQNYFYLKLNWKVWKLHFQNIFAELNAVSSNQNRLNTLVPKKYFAAHYLNLDITKNISIGIFEAIVFNRDNEFGRFELQYLNPVILYRTAEIYLDSPDNVLLGFELKWNLFKRVQLYHQFVFDTFKFDEWITNDQNWWGKKYGTQFGIKYINAFNVDHLDLQAEINIARPYTYSHRDSLGANYSHNNTSLAHPLGANFKEYIFIVKYQPFPKWYLEARYIQSEQGEDPIGENWGSNILISNETRQQEYNNIIGQGIKGQNSLLGLELTYQPWHNVFIDLQYFQRTKDSADNALDLSEKYIGVSTRVNIGRPRIDF